MVKRAIVDNSSSQYHNLGSLAGMDYRIRRYRDNKANKLTESRIANITKPVLQSVYHRENSITSSLNNTIS